jgi:hypothetical protein
MVYLARIEDTIYVLECFGKDTAKTERKELRRVPIVAGEAKDAGGAKR